MSQKPAVFKLDDDMTEEDLDRLAYAKDEEIQCAVARHPLTHMNTLVMLSQKNIRLALCVEQNPMFLFYLENAENGAVLVLEVIARRTNSQERIDEFSRMPWPQLRRAVVTNRHASAEVVNRLGDDLDDVVRIYVAGHSKTFPKVLEKLSKEKDQDIREQVAENKNTPANILMNLAQDSSEFVLRAVSSNPNAPLSALEILMKSKLDEVRAGVAGHRKSTSKMLGILAKDPDTAVRQTALSYSESRKQSRKNNPMVDISEDDIPEDASEDELLKLAMRGGVKRKRAALNHPNATLRVWEYVVVYDDDGKFGVDVWNNPVFQLLLASQEEDALQLLNRIVSKSKDQDLLVEWAKIPSLRPSVAMNEDISEKLGEEFLVDPDPQVRLSLAINTATPDDFLEVLCKDTVSLVAETARETLNEHAFNEAASVGFEPFPEVEEGDQDTPTTPAREERRSNPTMSADEAAAFFKRKITPPSVPDVPEDATENDLYRLAKSGDLGKMCAAAAHPNATMVVWEYLVRNNAYEVGESVWKNPLFQLLVAAQDPSLDYLLTEIAMRSRSETVVREMAHLPPVVRKYVALNDAVPEDLAEQFAIDENAVVRQYLAENKSAPKHLVERLLQDPVQLVRGSARSTLDHIQMIDDLEEKHR